MIDKDFFMFLSKTRQKLHHFQDLTERQRPLKPNLVAFLFVGSMDRESFQQLQMWFSEHFFAA